MKHKIGLVCLSIMVVALAVGCSSNKNSSIRANASTNESSRESRSEEKSRRKDENEVSSDEFLSVGESVIVSKNITDTNNKITLDNIIRGTLAKNEVDEYNSTNPTSKIPQLINDSLEYVIIEYTTTLADDLKVTKQGQASHVGIQVCNLDGSILHTSDTNYIIRSMNFEKNEGLQASDSGVTRTVITIPKNISEFIVRIGDNPSDMCSYIIK